MPHKETSHIQFGRVEEGSEAEADVGGEVFDGAEEGVGAALVPVAVEVEYAAEEEVA